MLRTGFYSHHVCLPMAVHLSGPPLKSLFWPRKDVVSLFLGINLPFQDLTFPTAYGLGPQYSLSLFSCLLLSLSNELLDLNEWRHTTPPLNYLQHPSTLLSF